MIAVSCSRIALSHSQNSPSVPEMIARTTDPVFPVPPMIAERQRDRPLEGLRHGRATAAGCASLSAMTATMTLAR